MTIFFYQKDKSDFEAVRAKLNASKSRQRPGGIKVLDELPRAVSPIENGTSELVKKMLQKKKGDQHENHDQNSAIQSLQQAVNNNASPHYDDQNIGE